MTLVATFAAAGAVTWLLRAAFIVLLPQDRASERLRRTLRYAAPAAFASLVAAGVRAGAPDGDPSAVVRLLGAVAVAAAVMRRTGNVTLTIGAGAAAATVLTGF